MKLIFYKDLQNIYQLNEKNIQKTSLNVSIYKTIILNENEFYYLINNLKLFNPLTYMPSYIQNKNIQCLEIKTDNYPFSVIIYNNRCNYAKYISLNYGNSNILFSNCSNN